MFQNVSHDPFYIADLDEIYYRHLLWKKNFSRVEPLYAMKSNYDCSVLKLFRHIGLGFDCSSRNEIKRLIKLNIPGEQILYANPVKQISDIKFARKVGVRGLVFDNEYEMEKIKAYHPGAECLLRIRVDSLAVKFGADRKKACELIKQAVDMNLNLVGVSFYVGFRQRTPWHIIESIKNARILFDYARESCNYFMNVLDIGGGFPGSWQSIGLFEEMAEKINLVLDELFPAEHFSNLCRAVQKEFKIIAELGTFYTMSSYTLCVNIVSKREIYLTPQEQENIEKSRKIFLNGAKNSLLENQETSESSIYTGKLNCSMEKAFIYYVNDSLHASFKWFSLSEVLPIFSSNYSECSSYFYSHVGGATCDSSDFIFKDCFMPELQIGDFLIFRNTGSYNKTGASAFNDIKLPSTIYVSSTMYDFMSKALSICRQMRNESCVDHEDIDSSDEVENENTVTPEEVVMKLFNNAKNQNRV